MPTKTIVLTEVADNIWHEEFSLTPGPDLQLAGSDDWRITKRTLRGGVSEGVEVVEIDNGALAVSVLPTRGMGVWKGEYQGLTLGWQSPVELPVHPAWINRMEHSGLGWLAGFNEWTCRCGLSSLGPPGIDPGPDSTGNPLHVPLTLHGRIAHCPAHRVEIEVTTDGRGRLSVRGVVDEAMLFGPRLRLTATVQTEAGSNRLAILDEVTNLGGQPAELQLLYHNNFGRPFLEPGAQIVAPVQQVAPATPRAAEGIATWQVYGEPTVGFAEQNYYLQLKADEQNNTLVLLRNATRERGVSVHFNRRQLPHFIIWKNTRSEAEGYVTGLEPATCLPNLKPFERQQGRVISLNPGESYRTEVELAVHASAEAVAGVERHIETLQGETSPVVHEQPQPQYTPAQ